MKTTKSSSNVFCSTISDSKFTALLKASRAGDKKARNEILMANFSLITKIASSVKTNKVDKADLINIAIIRFLEIINDFDETKGLSLSTYIWKPLTQAIHKSPDLNKTQLFNFKKEIDEATAYLEKQNGVKPSFKELASFLHVSFAPFLSKCNQIVFESNIVSLDKKINADSEDEITLLDTMACAFNNGEDASCRLMKKETAKAIRQAFNSLSKEDQKILLFRIGEDGEKKLSLRQAAALLGLSTQTIRNHEFQAIEQFKQALVEYGVFEDTTQNGIAA